MHPATLVAQLDIVRQNRPNFRSLRIVQTTVIIVATIYIHLVSEWCSLVGDF